jgi:hypothetical protein
LTADTDKDDLGRVRSRIPLLIAALLAAVIAVLLIARVV